MPSLAKRQLINHILQIFKQRKTEKNGKLSLRSLITSIYKIRNTENSSFEENLKKQRLCEEIKTAIK